MAEAAAAAAVVVAVFFGGAVVSLAGKTTGSGDWDAIEAVRTFLRGFRMAESCECWDPPLPLLITSSVCLCRMSSWVNIGLFECWILDRKLSP
jgi:hypothetical protein